MIESARAFLIGVAESAHPVERGLFHKAAKLLEFFFGFAGKADDERSPQSNAGNDAAHFLDGAQEQVGAASALHALQDRRRGVLQRHVDVGTNIVVGGDRLQQSSGDFVGISVKEANPLQAVDASELFQQQSEAVFQSEIFAVAGCVLSDERDFAHAGLRQSFGFGDHGFETPRAKLSAKLGNDAEAAGMIAAFGDFDIGGGSRRGQHARRVVVVKIVGQVGDGAVPGIAGEAALLAAMIALGPRGRGCSKSGY